MSFQPQTRLRSVCHVQSQTQITVHGLQTYSVRVCVAYYLRIGVQVWFRSVKADMVDKDLLLSD